MELRAVDTRGSDMRSSTYFCVDNSHMLNAVIDRLSPLVEQIEYPCYLGHIAARQTFQKVDNMN
jgi:hypothetical protein